MSEKIAFVAKWRGVIVNAERQSDGTFAYVMPSDYIVCSEVSKPYDMPNYQDHDAVKAKLAADSVDLLPAYTGHNLDMSLLVLPPGRLTYRFFKPDEMVQEGDALLIIVQQMTN